MENKQRNKSIKTKQSLTDCAVRLFYEKGFGKTTVKEIVKGSGVAQGTFYLYFHSKDQVLFIILEEVINSVNNILENMPTENPKFEDLDRIIDLIVEYMHSNPKSIAILHSSNIIEIMNRNGGIKPVEFSLVTIEKWIINANDKGIINKKNASLYAKIIFHMIHEMLEGAFLTDYPDNIHIVKDEVKKIIRNVLKY